MKVATGNTKRRGKTERLRCPECMTAYMQHAYILVHDQKKRTWKGIGKYCNVCGHFLPERVKKDKTTIG